MANTKIIFPGELERIAIKLIKADERLDVSVDEGYSNQAQRLLNLSYSKKSNRRKEIHAFCESFEDGEGEEAFREVLETRRTLFPNNGPGDYILKLAISWIEEWEVEKNLVDRGTGNIYQKLWGSPETLEIQAQMHLNESQCGRHWQDFGRALQNDPTGKTMFIKNLRIYRKCLQEKSEKQSCGKCRRIARSWGRPAGEYHSTRADAKGVSNRLSDLFGILLILL